MDFWGIEVKPGKPHTCHDNLEGTLYVTQATLGRGKSTDRSILQCSVGHKSPIFLCSLIPGKTEYCSLNLEFKDELVAFSAVGKRSIHISGYFEACEGNHLPDEYEPDSGEDIGYTESDGKSGKFDYDDGDDDFKVIRSSPVPIISGVVVNEIEDDDQLTYGDGVSKLKKKKNVSGRVSVLESEEEDGFPVPTTETDGHQDKPKQLKKKKRKVMVTAAPDGQPKKKKRGQQKQKRTEENVVDMVEGDQKELAGDETQPADTEQGSLDINEGDRRETEVDEGSPPRKSASKKNKKKRKNKKANGDGESTVETPVPGVSSFDSDEKQSASEPSKVRTFRKNGILIENLAMGKADGKLAASGDIVRMRYTGKLKKNDTIFDSNLGWGLIFRLGHEQVINGLDIGVEDMRVGDKRRLTIPPAFGYSCRGASRKIPPMSWLIFDVELVDVS